MTYNKADPGIIAVWSIRLNGRRVSLGTWHQRDCSSDEPTSWAPSLKYSDLGRKSVMVLKYLLR